MKDAIPHIAPPHKVVWIVDPGGSVFGLTQIHAVLKCKKCGVRRPPELIKNECFEISGTSRLTYKLKEQFDSGAAD